MTLVAWPIMAGAITLDATNNVIRFKEGAATNNVTIPANTYFLSGDGSATDLIAAIKTQLDAFGATNTYTITLTFSSTSANPTASISIAQSGGATFQFLFADALTTFRAVHIGFTQVNTLDNTTTKVSTLSPRGLWVSDQPVKEIEPIKQRAVFANTAKSGKIKAGARSETWSLRSVAFENVHKLRTWFDVVSASDTEAAFDSFLDYVGDGKETRLYLADFEAAATTVTIGTLHFSGEISADSLEEFRPERLEPGVALYDFSIVMGKHL